MPNRSKTILFVVHNDNQVVRQIAKMTSELADVINARDSARAIAMIDSTQPISIALVGHTENGVSAIDILGHLRSRRSQARGIMLADPSDLSASIEALHSGVVDHVMNFPLRERELLALIALPSPRPIAMPNVSIRPPLNRAV